MKYSLRSLFLVVTLIAVVVGGRIEYLRRMAEYHEKMAGEIAATIHAYARLDRDDLDAHVLHASLERRQADLAIALHCVGVSGE